MTADPDPVLSATAPARWLLDLGLEGVPLTQTHALARAVVRDAARRWPHWWDAELFGEPYREAELAPLEALHDGLRRLRLVRRRGRMLHTTPRGRELLVDPAALLGNLAADLAGSDPFTEMVADVVISRLGLGPEAALDGLTTAALDRAQRGGWRSGNDVPSEADVSWVVTDVMRRGEAYGLIDWRIDRARSMRLRIALTEAGRRALGVARDVDGIAG